MSSTSNQPAISFAQFHKNPTVEQLRSIASSVTLREFEIELSYIYLTEKEEQVAAQVLSEMKEMERVLFEWETHLKHPLKKALDETESLIHLMRGSKETYQLELPYIPDISERTESIVIDLLCQCGVADPAFQQKPMAVHLPYREISRYIFQGEGTATRFLDCICKLKHGYFSH